MGDVAVEVALHLRALHGEGPLWDRDTARLWWIDINGERVHCFDPVSGRDCSWPVSGQPGAVVLDSAGNPVVAMPDGLSRLDRATGAGELRVPVERDKSENRANDAKVDSRGRLWLGTMAFDKRPGNATLYRVIGKTVTPMVEGLSVSNGPGLDEAGGRLYLADTPRGALDLFDLAPETGTISHRRRFHDFSAAGVLPDGMTVDDEGMVWIALGRAGAVHRYRPDGTLDGVIEVPTSNPTSVTFGGPEGGELFITTSWSDLDHDERPNQPLAGALFVCRPGVTGAPSPRYLAPDAADRI